MPGKQKPRGADRPHTATPTVDWETFKGLVDYVRLGSIPKLVFEGHDHSIVIERFAKPQKNRRF